MTSSGSQRPLVTVALPVFNMERTVLDAVESIRLQTFQDWELLVIDDGSTDGTKEVLARVRDPRVRIISHRENAGLPQRLNEAVALGRGEYFARLDADDVAYPERLEVQLRYLREHPAVDIVGSWLMLLDEHRRGFGLWSPPEDHAAIAVRPFHSILLAHPTFLGRRSWFVAHAYDPKLRLGGEDQILLMETAADSTFANVQQVLVGYRQPSTKVRTALPRRITFCAYATRSFLRRKEYWNCVRNVLTHSCVGAVECIAELSGLRNRLLRHRVSRLSALQLERWKEVWTAIFSATHANDGATRREHAVGYDRNAS